MSRIKTLTSAAMLALAVALAIFAAGGLTTSKLNAQNLGDVAGAGVPTAQGPYDPEQLRQWHARSVGLFEIQGVVLTDVDEENDRLVVGVEHLGLARAVEQKLKELDIPRDAVTIRETAPIVLAQDLQTLRDMVRPLEGGLQISFQKKNTTYRCTLGFNAIRAGVPGFVVASHCTTTYGGVDGTQHYQPTVADANLIGTEIADPEFYRCAAYINVRNCRYSDAAFDQLAGVEADLGLIERTDGVNTGSLTIAGSFRITAEASGNAVGQTLNKVGRTTGWTQGLVTMSCAHTRVAGTNNKIFLCQDFVEAGVGPGDSGSPVFRITSGDDVTLYGILWGATLDGTLFAYSPIANVQAELGSLNTCAPVIVNGC